MLKASSQKSGILCFLAVALSAEAVQAQNDSLVYEGSDALQFELDWLTKFGDCRIAIDYVGRGDAEAEAVLGSRSSSGQQTALMSVPLSEEFCRANPQAVQLKVGEDDLVFSRTSSANQSDLACSESIVRDVPGYVSSEAPSWAEAIQLIYGGRQGEGSKEACLDPKRLALIRDWSSLWSDACPSGNCQRLRFAFRPGDGSGMVQIMQKVFGITGFCNGKQHEDLDPIRTDCSDPTNAKGVQYCPYGDLGVVQSIVIPPSLPATQRRACQTGKFEYAFGDQLCPDTTRPFAGFLCQYPLDCDGKMGCVNSGVNGTPVNPFMDGRDFNHAHLAASGEPLNLPEAPAINGQAASYGFAPLFFNGSCPAGLSGHDPMHQIGCLVDAVDCSIGFGGNSLMAAKRRANDESSTCARESTFKVTPVHLNGFSFESDEYPIPRKRFYLNAVDVPVSDGELVCDSVRNSVERDLCVCMQHGTLSRIGMVQGEGFFRRSLVECGEG